jgi:hypothetical protein
MMLAAEWEALVFEHRRESFPILSLSLLEPLTRRVLVQSIPHYYYCCTSSTPLPLYTNSTVYNLFLSTILIKSPPSPARIGATLRTIHAGTLLTLTSASR